MSMNSKPTTQPVRVPSQPIKRAYQYFEEIKAEFVKINWTEGDEVFTYAKVVVAATFIFGMVIYTADLLIQRLILSFDIIFKWLVG